VTRLIVWRHGQTVWNQQQRIQGQTDVDLDDVGRQQAAAAAQLLVAKNPDLIVSSDLRRAQDTAQALATLTGLPVDTDSRLRERVYGLWEGLTHPEIEARWPEKFQQWRRGEPVTDVGIESYDDVGKRVSAALADIAERAQGGTAVVVTHGGAARHGVGAFLGWANTVPHTLGPLANCHWIELRQGRGGAWRMETYNVGPQL